MKTAYLVRHGESRGNASPIFLSEGTGLTEKGRAEAAAAAVRCAKLGAGALISSTMERARETAKIIGAGIGMRPEFSDLFVERKFPSDFLGKRRDDPEVLDIVRRMHDGRGAPGFRFSDEDNFEDLNARASKALAHLAELPAEKIVLITHGFFMRVMAARVFFGDALTAAEYARVANGLMTDNAGISAFRYDSENAAAPWSVLAWNDSAHLS